MEEEVKDNVMTKIIVRAMRLGKQQGYVLGKNRGILLGQTMIKKTYIANGIIIGGLLGVMFGEIIRKLH